MWVKLIGPFFFHLDEFSRVNQEGKENQLFCQAEKAAGNGWKLRAKLHIIPPSASC